MVHDDVYRTSYRGFLPDEYLDSLVVDDEAIAKAKAKIEKGEGYVAVYKSNVVAFADVKNLDENVFEIEALYVHPNYHQKGIGKKIVNYIFDLKKAEGYKCVSIWTMKHGEARGFYKNLGCVQSDKCEKFWRFDIPIIEFVKDIT